MRQRSYAEAVKRLREAAREYATAKSATRIEAADAALREAALAYAHLWEQALAEDEG